MSVPLQNTVPSAPVRLPHRQLLAFESWSVPLFSILTGLMTFMSAYALLASLFKAALIGCIAALVSLAVNHFAIHRGAELTATGFRWAGGVCIISILAVGAGLAPSTYAGLVIGKVDDLQIQHYISDQAQFMDDRNRLATQASRLIPMIQINEEELRQYRDCEERESCLSGRGQGGRGVVTRKLEEKQRRAASIAEILQAGELERKAVLKRLNTLNDTLKQQFADTEKTPEARRRHLTTTAAKIQQALTALDEALPVSTLEAYVSELESGVSLPERPQTDKRIDALLQKQAEGLSAVLASLDGFDDPQPQFPAPAGVTTTFDWIGHFWPMAALTVCIELVFPLSLWVYVLLGLIWQKHQAEFTQTQVQASVNPSSSGQRRRRARNKTPNKE